MSDLNKSKETKLIYEGSVKRLWQCPDDGEKLWFEFTDDYSIFDWGKMPDTIANKGRALAFLGAHFFETLKEPSFWQELSTSKHMKRFGGDWLKRRFSHPVFQSMLENGLPHHFHQLSDGVTTVDRFAIAGADKVYMEVMRADVPNPELKHIFDHELYFYPHVAGNGRHYRRRLVPLEIVFRFGMPEGSSLISRLKKNPQYLKELGLPATPTPGEWFPSPVIELFTKLEPSDRLLSWAEASLVSGLPASAFENMLETTQVCALALYHIFAEKGLELWDGKFEFIVEYGNDDVPRVLLADSIGPDELRLIYHGQHLSKELVRQIYKDSNWSNALKKAKDLARQRNNGEFKQICIQELKQTPAAMTAEEKSIVDSLYGSLANHLAGKEVFPQQPTLDQFVSKVESTFRQSRAEEHATTTGGKHPRRKASGAQSGKTSIHQEREISVRPRSEG